MRLTYSPAPPNGVLRRTAENKMSAATIALPRPDTVLAGPFWPGRVRVLRADLNGPSVRIQAVGVADSQ